MTRKAGRQKPPKIFKGKKSMSYSEISKRMSSLQNTIDEFHRESDLVFSVVNPKERDRLIALIQRYINDNQNNDTWIFPTQIYNMENLMEAASIVKALPGFQQYHYSFSTAFNSDKSMGALYISRNSLDPNSLKAH